MKRLFILLVGFIIAMRLTSCCNTEFEYEVVTTCPEGASVEYKPMDGVRNDSAVNWKSVPKFIGKKDKYSDLYAIYGEEGAKVWTYRFTGPRDGHFFISAVNKGKGSLTVRIKEDGHIIKSSKSNGSKCTAEYYAF